MDIGNFPLCIFQQFEFFFIFALLIFLFTVHKEFLCNCSSSENTKLTWSPLTIYLITPLTLFEVYIFSKYRIKQKKLFILKKLLNSIIGSEIKKNTKNTMNFYLFEVFLKLSADLTRYLQQIALQNYQWIFFIFYSFFSSFISFLFCAPFFAINCLLINESSFLPGQLVYNTLF